MLSQSHRGLPSARPNWYIPKGKNERLNCSILISIGKVPSRPLRHPKLAKPTDAKQAFAVQRGLFKVGRLPSPTAIYFGH